MKLFHLYLEGGPAPPMTSSIRVFHLGISLVADAPQQSMGTPTPASRRHSRSVRASVRS